MTTADKGQRKTLTRAQTSPPRILNNRWRGHKDPFPGLTWNCGHFGRARVPGPPASLLDGGERSVGRSALPRRERRELGRVRMIDSVQSQVGPTTVNIERKVGSLVLVSGDPDRSSETLNLSRVLKHWWRSSLLP
jgi:hypothetical protein